MTPCAGKVQAPARSSSVRRVAAEHSPGGAVLFSALLPVLPGHRHSSGRSVPPPLTLKRPQPGLQVPLESP